MLLLAAIGVVTVIVLSIRLTTRMLDNTAQKEMFARMITPVVMFDPVPFESAENIQNSDLLLYSMWSALMSENRRYYTFNQNQELQIPAPDLDAAVRTLFGGVVRLEHRTFEDFETTYTYDAGRELYTVPVTAELYVYTPRVTDIVRRGDYYELTVEYIPPGSAWTVSFTGITQEPEPDKTMIYVMARAGRDNWHIVRVRDLSPESPSG
jgi:hypothetical protein